MQISFKNQIVVVTGAASGIGCHAVNLFVEAGAHVVALDIQERVDSKNEMVHDILCDVSKPESVLSAFSEIGESHERIDVLVNNAGIQTYGDVLESSVEDWDHTLDVNLKSVFLCSKHAIPLMRSSSRPVIVNVSSVQSFISQRKVAAYAVSKSGVNALTRCMAIDFAPHIRCVAVSPGAVLTPMLERDIASCEDPQAATRETEEIHLLERIASPDEIANFIVMLASDHASFATGQVFRVDGGIGVRIEGT